tara:strand:- start:1156 stop:1560 length:405 start_codon:yes stop_codon:yes gene_type:complete
MSKKKFKKEKKILVDMSATIIHHGHIRLLKKARKFGKIYVALTSDEEIKKYKKVKPIFNYMRRKEVVSSLKYVSGVIKSNFFIDNKFLKKNKIDLLIHGSDNKNKVDKKYLKIFKRTKLISSTILRKDLIKNLR